MQRIVVFIVSLFMLCISVARAQIAVEGNQTFEIDYSNPVEYEIGGITVTGTKFLDHNALILLSGLSVGDKIKIPGDETAKAIKSLWKQKLFSDVKISVARVDGNKIFLNFQLDELPRLSKFKFNGSTKSETDDIKEDINLYREKIISDNIVSATLNATKDYYVDKGFLNVEVNVNQYKDSVIPNHVVLEINIKKNKKVKISEIEFIDNEEISDAVLRRAMKEVKEGSIFHPFHNFDSLLFVSVKNIFLFRFNRVLYDVMEYSHNHFRVKVLKSSKFIESNYDDDKRAVVEKYMSKGFRDASIIHDTIFKTDKNRIKIQITVGEGNKYYFRNIYWVGNTKYSSKLLGDVLGIKKGDVFDQSTLESRLYMNQNGDDVSSIYMDDGYLFFDIQPTEILVENDSIDFEMRIYEGQQARVNKVSVSGNTKTHDHVIMREVRTKPGQLFSRADIIRTQRELAQLGYFNAEKLNVVPKPNPANSTVDIDYEVEEKPSDQLELSGGWGGGRVVGTLGVSFTNFSLRNTTKKNAWQPLPSGDGQRLSIRAQSNGTYYQSYNISFTEPWLGGKKANALSVTAYHSVQSNGQTKYEKDDETKKYIKDENGDKILNEDRASILITGVSVGLGRRIKWPDDYFTLYQEVAFQNYNMDKWSQFVFSDGNSKNLFYRANISRNSVDQPIYPRFGSQISLTLQATPPYSMFKEEEVPYADQSLQEKFQWIEYHKWKFTASWFNKIYDNLVLNTRVGYGFLGYYNRELGSAPFERYYLGGSGLTGFALDGREIIALRGYDDQSVSPTTGGTIISKYTMEMRYPFSLNPSATIYGLGFVEAGNTWNKFSDYNPFLVKRSAGLGIRLFLPMFGLLGLDWGYRFDDIPNRTGMQRSQIHFTIGANIGEL